jgi:hypothetical protein
MLVLKTIALMDELESVVVLNGEHARLVLGAAYREGAHVLLTAGQKGVVRGGSFSMRGDDKSSFVFESLFAISLTGGEGSKAGETNDLQRVVSIEYLSQSGQVVVATADRVIYLLDMYVPYPTHFHYHLPLLEFL